MTLLTLDINMDMDSDIDINLYIQTFFLSDPETKLAK